MLPLLETFTEFPYQNNLHSCQPIFSNIPDVLKSIKVDFPILETAKIHQNPNQQSDSVPVQQYITGQLYAINSSTEGA
jgi:hypothetical protein